MFDLPVARVSSWIFNCYLLDGPDDALVVVDPGLPLVTQRAIDLVERDLGRPADAVTTIASTHGHPDHVGGVADLQRRSGAVALLPSRCEAYLGGERPRTFGLLEASSRFMPVWREQPFELAALRELGAAGRRLDYGGPGSMEVDFQVDGFLADGDELPGAPGWTVVHTPGHTDDSTCFYHRESATLVAGDALATQDGSAWFNPEYVDLAESRETEERLRALEVRHLLPGHGPPLAAPDVWRTARSCTERPTGRSLLARCSRRIGRWR